MTINLPSGIICTINFVKFPINDFIIIKTPKQVRVHLIAYESASVKAGNNEFCVQTAIKLYGCMYTGELI